MADYLHVSNGSGIPVTAIVTTDRGVGSTQLIVDSVLNWPAKGIAQSGTPNPITGVVTDKSVFYYHLDGSIITIESYAAGYYDIGNFVDQVVILKPTSEWANEVADRLEQPSLPNGGTEGQILTKLSATDGDAGWEEPGGGVSIITKETPTGLVNGTNMVFTTAQPYVGGSLQFYINGLAQSSFVTETDPATGVCTLDVAPLTGDDVKVSYQFAASTTNAADTLDGYHLSGILEAIYPVGAVYISGSSTMPAIINSIGTWVRLKGRMIVGLDEAQTEFDTINETGGQKTVMAHAHDIKVKNDDFNFTGTSLGVGPTFADARDGTTVLTNFSNIVQSAGTGVNNMNPYKVKYMWERTA